jgi:hypothetical protein
MIFEIYIKRVTLIINIQRLSNDYHLLLLKEDNSDIETTINMAQAPAKIAKTGGDDLDDGLELDPELLASDNEDESDAEFENDADIGEEETRVAVDEDSEDENDGGADVGEKRKREGDGEGEDAAAEKRKRKREKFKERKAKVRLVFIS